MSKRRRDIRPDGLQPLPAGHPDTWGLIIRGTCLEGMPWPGPGGGNSQDARNRASSRRGQSQEDT